MLNILQFYIVQGYLWSNSLENLIFIPSSVQSGKKIKLVKVQNILYVVNTHTYIHTHTKESVR